MNTVISGLQLVNMARLYDCCIETSLEEAAIVTEHVDISYS